MAFSPKDGFLYIGTGDGGGAGDPFNNAQNPQSLLGKILRIDLESPPAPGNNYVIPPTNPFVGSVGFRREIWALGLRNPWRFSFDRLTGDLYIGDVGQSTFEEVDFQPASSVGGENYGWNILEGPSCFNLPNCGLPSGYVPPVMFYGHPEGIAVVGGYVYRGTKFGLVGGVYFFGDLIGEIWGLQQVAGVWQRQLLSTTGFPISTFGEDEAGNLYVADYSAGKIYEMKITTVLYAGFGSSAGTWMWNGSNWSKFTASDPQNLVASGSLLYADFGSAGTWLWNGSSWTQLTLSDPENMVVPF